MSIRDLIDLKNIYNKFPSILKITFSVILITGIFIIFFAYRRHCEYCDNNKHSKFFGIECFPTSDTNATNHQVKENKVNTTINAKNSNSAPNYGTMHVGDDSKK